MVLLIDKLIDKRMKSEELSYIAKTPYVILHSGTFAFLFINIIAGVLGLLTAAILTLVMDFNKALHAVFDFIFWQQLITNTMWIVSAVIAVIWLCVNLIRLPSKKYKEDVLLKKFGKAISVQSGYCLFLWVYVLFDTGKLCYFLFRFICLFRQ